MPEDLNLVNKLYYGDNLIIMREFIPPECVDLIYLDPPFNSKATVALAHGDRVDVPDGALRLLDETQGDNQRVDELLEYVVTLWVTRCSAIVSVIGH